MYELRVHPSIADVGKDEWDRLARPLDVPFLRSSWLDALEKTGCVGPGTGWHPHHLTLSKGGVLAAVAPAYLKEHSQGEFVFDHGWANAAYKFGVDYFPKLLVAVPFTPANAPRVLVADGFDRTEALTAIATGLAKLTEHSELSSAHLLFPPEADARALGDAGMSHRYGIQFHWRNEGFSTFEDFLSTLPSKRRTQIRRERKALSEQGLTIETHRGADITEELVDTAYRFYTATVNKFIWGRHYLNLEFFKEVCERMPEDIEIVVARDGRRAIAGAFNLMGGGVLYGRYWGATEERPFLHFNVCYYHSIDECIARGLQRFEPGAGGSHKVARGFYPTLTHSLHYIAHPRFAAAIEDFVTREREALVEHITAEWGTPPRALCDGSS